MKQQILTLAEANLQFICWGKKIGLTGTIILANIQFGSSTEPILEIWEHQPFPMRPQAIRFGRFLIEFHRNLEPWDTGLLKKSAPFVERAKERFHSKFMRTANLSYKEDGGRFIHFKGWRT